MAPVCRVSTPKQAKGNHTQEVGLRAAAAAQGCPVVEHGVEPVVGHPTGDEFLQYLSLVSRAAASYEDKQGLPTGTVVLLAESTTRFIRPTVYNEKRPNARPCSDHWATLHAATHNRTLATKLPPDEPDRSEQTSRGNPGRPPRRQEANTKDRFEKWWPVVQRLHRAGLTYREIEERTTAMGTRIPARTVGNWLCHFLAQSDD